MYHPTATAHTAPDRKICINLAWIEQEAGIFNPILECTQDNIDYIQDGWISRFAALSNWHTPRSSFLESQNPRPINMATPISWKYSGIMSPHQPSSKHSTGVDCTSKSQGHPILPTLLAHCCTPTSPHSNEANNPPHSNQCIPSARTNGPSNHDQASKQENSGRDTSRNVLENRQALIKSPRPAMASATRTT